MLHRLLRLLPAKRGLEVAALFTAVASLLAGVLIARMLGPSGRGQVVVVATWGQALAWAGGLSIDKALMARNSVDGRRQTRMPLAAGLPMMLLIGAAVATVSIVATTSILEPPLLRTALAVVVLGTVACDARAAQLLCQDRWRDFAMLRFAQPAVYLVGCLTAGAVVPWNPEAGVGLVVAALCASLWVPALFVGGLPRLRLVRPSRAEMTAMLAFGGAYHVGSVLSFLTSRIDLMAVSLRFGMTEVGIYSVAASLGQLAALFGSANLMRGITGKLKSSRVDRGGLMAASVMTAAVAGCAPWLLEHVYGPEFAVAGELARYLCVGGLLFYLRQGFNGQLTGLGRPWATAWANGVGVVSFLAMLPLTGTPTGIAAASAIAAGLSTAVAVGLLWWYDSRRPGPPRKADTATPPATAVPEPEATRPASLAT